MREASLCKKLRNIEVLQDVLSVAHERSRLKYAQHQDDDDLLNLIDAPDIICEQRGGPCGVQGAPRDLLGPGALGRPPPALFARDAGAALLGDLGVAWGVQGVGVPGHLLSVPSSLTPALPPRRALSGGLLAALSPLGALPESFVTSRGSSCHLSPGDLSSP